MTKYKKLDEYLEKKGKNLNEILERKVEKENKLKEFKEKEISNKKPTVANLTKRVDRLEEIIKLLLENKNI